MILCGERLAGPFAGVFRGGVGADEYVAEAGGVAHRSAQHTLGDEAEHRLSALRPVRHQPTRRFQADEAVAGGRDADGPATVVGARGGDDARRDRRGGPTRRSAGRVPEIPRVAGGSPELGFGDGLGAELGSVGLAEHDEARVEQASRVCASARSRRRRPARASPHEVGYPAYSCCRSLIRNGTPANGPASGPFARRSASRMRATIAFSAGFTSAARARAKASSSPGVTSPRATSSARPVASWAMYSSRCTRPMLTNRTNVQAGGALTCGL